MKKEPFYLVGAAALFWALDAGSKMLAHAYLKPLPVTVIPNFCHLVLCTNPGGSFGIPGSYMELCLTLPAAVILALTVWFARRIKKRYAITALMYLGFGLFVGGTLGNWSERVLHGGVTDFIHLQCFDFCIFNMADAFIDLGYIALALEIFRLARQRRLTVATTVTPSTNN